MRRFAYLVLVVALAACGGRTASGLLDSFDAGEVPAPCTDTSSVSCACANQAAASCALRESCTHGFSTEINYGSTSVCVSQQTASCVANLAAPDTANTVAHVQGCAAAYPTEACVDWWGNNPAAACRSLAGTRANGAACGVNAQCASAFCSTGPNARCGSCQPTPQPGDACEVNSQCGYDLDCPIVAPATSGVCTVRSGVGGPCDGYHPCGGGGLACIGSNTTEMITGTCQTGSATVGAACDYQVGPGCNGEVYLHCTSGMCEPEPVVGAGQPCGDVGPAYVNCAAGALCVKPLGSTMGTCVAPVANGAACDSAAGPPCLTPAKCISTTDGGTSGTCVFPDPARCG